MMPLIILGSTEIHTARERKNSVIMMMAVHPGHTRKVDKPALNCVTSCCETAIGRDVLMTRQVCRETMGDNGK